MATVAFDSPVKADDWPQFLGKLRNGKSSETGLVDRLPKSGVKINWRKSLGEGMSGISIVDANVYTMYQDDSKQYVVCLDAETGATRWTTPVAPRYQNSMGHGPRATPTVTDKGVFVFTGEGILAALDLKGKLMWKVDTAKAGKPAEYGMASSPLLVDDTVIVGTQPGRFTVSGYAVKDGEFLWGTNNQNSGYSSPAFLTLGEKKYITMFCGESLFGVEPVSGRMIWQYDFPTEYNCNTANPINIGNRILISSGENHGSVLLEAGKPGKPKAVWSSLGRTSVLRSEWQTPILHDEYLYGFDNVGSASPVTHLNCVNAKTGELVWQKKRFGKGNLIFADGKLIISTMKGELVLVNATPKGFEELGREKIIGQTRQAWSLSNGNAYLRDNSEIVSIDLKQSSN